MKFTDPEHKELFKLINEENENIKKLIDKIDTIGNDIRIFGNSLLKMQDEYIDLQAEVAANRRNTQRNKEEIKEHHDFIYQYIAKGKIGKAQFK